MIRESRYSVSMVIFTMQWKRIAAGIGVVLVAAALGGGATGCGREKPNANTEMRKKQGAYMNEMDRIAEDLAKEEKAKEKEEKPSSSPQTPETPESTPADK